MNAILTKQYLSTVTRRHEKLTIRSNPDGEDGAWCYTTDPEVRWELCGVRDCASPAPPRTDCGTASRQQTDYRGTQSVTESGLTCQRWDEQTPHEHGVTSDKYPDAGLEENYCR